MTYSNMIWRGYHVQNVTEHQTKGTSLMRMTTDAGMSTVGKCLATVVGCCALVVCPAGHPAEHLEKIGVAESMRCIMLQDRLLGVGVREATLEILGGMVEQDPSVHERNLQRAFELGRTFFHLSA